MLRAEPSRPCPGLGPRLNSQFIHPTEKRDVPTQTAPVETDENDAGGIRRAGSAIEGVLRILAGVLHVRLRLVQPAFGAMPDGVVEQVLERLDDLRQTATESGGEESGDLHLGDAEFFGDFLLGPAVEEA